MALNRHLTPKDLRRRVRRLIKMPFFWWLTLWGNGFIFGGATFFHLAEGDSNPEIHSYLDSLGWAVAIVSTVGSGTVVPLTVAGKVLAIFMMMGGAVFLWTYMAMFVGILVDPELNKIERELAEIQHDLENGKSDSGAVRRASLKSDRK